MKVMRTSLVFLATAVLAGCSSSTNTNPPSYISDLVTYGEGFEAFVCYFVLKDTQGVETASDGRYTLRVEDENGVIYTRTRAISAESFQKATVGQGAFERERLLYYIGRITYSEFRRDPEGYTGTVSLEFVVNGKTLRGEDTLFFD